MNATDQLAASRARLRRVVRPEAHQPGVGGVTDALLSAYLGPVATQRPVALVLSAAAVGALLAWSRPWKWVDREALVRVAIPYLITHLLREQENKTASPQQACD